MIKKSEITMGRDRAFPGEWTEEISQNIDRLLSALNVVREKYGKPMTVASGWRPRSYNNTIKAAGKQSNHTMGLACDIRDDGTLRDWVLENLELMQQLGLYFEDFRWTPGWVHFQIIPPKSGKRIYIPFANQPALRPKAWSGKYDKRFDGDLP